PAQTLAEVGSHAARGCLVERIDVLRHAKQTRTAALGILKSEHPAQGVGDHALQRTHDGLHHYPQSQRLKQILDQVATVLAALEQLVRQRLTDLLEDLL